MVRHQPQKAIPYYQEALTKVIPTHAQRKAIEQKLEEAKKKVGKRQK